MDTAQDKQHPLSASQRILKGEESFCNPSSHESTGHLELWHTNSSMGKNLMDNGRVFRKDYYDGTAVTLSEVVVGVQ